MTPALGPYRRLLGYSARYWPLLAAAACGMVLEALSAGAFTWMMRPIVSETFVARNPDVGLLLPLAIVALFLVRGMATFVVDYAMARTGRGVVRDLRSALMAKFLAIPPAALAAEPAPARISRLSYDTEQVAQASAEALKILLTDVLTVLVLLTVMLAQSVKVTLALLLLAPAVGGITVAVSRRYRRLHGRIQEGMASMAAHAEQTLAASDEVRLHGAEAIELGRFQSEAERNFRLHLKVESTRAAASSLVQLAAAGGARPGALSCRSRSARGTYGRRAVRRLNDRDDGDDPLAQAPGLGPCPHREGCGGGRAHLRRARSAGGRCRRDAADRTCSRRASLRGSRLRFSR